MNPDTATDTALRDRLDYAIYNAHTAAQRLEGYAAAVVTDFAKGRIPSAGRVRILEDTVAVLAGALATIRELEKANG